MSAQANGAFISVTITNTGNEDLQITPTDFAVIPRGTRQVVPYSAEGATIDMPRVVRPGETVQGRARFREFQNPAGDRLVFKPDGIGTYAEISGTPVPLQGHPSSGPTAREY
jgi:hypothetical protein